MNFQEALFWKNLPEKKVQCDLCPHRCIIYENSTGLCGVRKNENGKLHTLIYKKAASVCADPIEKKPLYNFYPGTYVLSFGTIGCNFFCKHCQNFTISQARNAWNLLQEIDFDDILKLINKWNCGGISWTYNEPTIWYEFTYDISKKLKSVDKKLYTIYVTNGYINEEPLRKIALYLDAMNIDIKAMNEKFYREICRSRLEPVLNTVKLAKSLNIHVELTYLIIPELNDTYKEIEKFVKWVGNEVGRDTPVHFSRFFPHYKMHDKQITPMRTLIEAYELGLKYLDYVYLGNVGSSDYENTYCPNCKTLLIERYGFSVTKNLVSSGKCYKCGKDINLRQK